MIPYQTMLSYDPKKLACHSYPAWKVIALDWVAKLLGIHIKIDGVPYGAEYKADFCGENCDGGPTPWPPPSKSGRGVRAAIVQSS